MGSVERIRNVAQRVAKWHQAGHQLVVVPSAMSGETNRLIALATQLQPQPDLSYREALFMRQPQYGPYVLHGHSPRLLVSWHAPPRSLPRSAECSDTAANDQPSRQPRNCPGLSEIPVRDLLKCVSGTYRNHCPGLRETRTTSQPIEIERVPPVRDRIRGGEARGFPSDTPENTRFVSLARTCGSVRAKSQENKGLRA